MKNEEEKLLFVIDQLTKEISKAKVDYLELAYSYSKLKQENELLRHNPDKEDNK